MGEPAVDDVKGTWRDRVHDEDERRVLDALADEHWDFRTIRSISADTGLREDTVADILARSEFVRVSDAPGPDGDTLFTLKSQPVSKREAIAATQAVITKTAV